MASVLRGSGASTLGGALDVQGVLSYEDVTSVDSIGIVTARSGLHVGTGASIFSPDTNELALGTNNTQRFTVSSGGNVGINDTDPNFKLDVNGDIGIREGNNLVWHDASGTAAFRIRAQSDNILRFERASGNEQNLTIDDGKIGIGVDNPTYKVSVKDTKADGTGVQLHLWNNSTDNVGGNVWSGIRFTGSTADYETAEIKGWRSHPGTGLNSLSINTGGVERMVLSSSGVGIGTNSPEEILHVAAASETVNSRDGVLFHSTSSLAADTGLPLVFTSDLGSGFPNYGVASIAGRKENANTSDGAGYLQFSTGASNGVISEKMRIDSSGAIVLPNGSPGIQFGTFSSPATSTTLDDYEEGSWTPTLNKAGTTGTVSGYNSRFGYYRKVGGSLFLSFYMYKSSGSFGTGVSAWYVSGIPFNIATLSNSAYQFIMGGYHAMNGQNFNFPSSVTGGGEASGSRWQANGVNGATTLTLYGMLYTTNWSSGTIELSGCGVLML